jgi:NADH:ubiquinone oxidoreductase subunit F (NADH-binding)
VTLSGLRGRGGGGFRTGRKWLSVLDASRDDERRFVVCNGAEGEPGTFKDRAILRHNQVIEGLAIAALTVRASQAFLAVKSSFTVEVEILRRALVEMRAVGLAGQVPISLVLGPDSYLFGEEKALLEVIEGEDPLPRRDPPYVHGLFASGPQMGWSAHRGGDAGGEAANPTIVNNVETHATVPHILTNGAEWYRALGLGTRRAPWCSPSWATWLAPAMPSSSSAPPSETSSNKSGADPARATRSRPSFPGSPTG